ncbi:VOC family protein [Streptomyces olivochromogenes]|uniref:Glyoxalase n=1 Tax=Streptomyces olivochromogenes TaxID=1963 RepID=A0A250VQA2_STROL|nr:VOC family protein [Streptomyces olivochromogenes]GAX56259.1 glyoxalase [Streptomyces olivochromogenes]
MSNLDDSLDWYQLLFSAERVDYKFNHLYRESTGYGVLPITPESGVVIGLRTDTVNQHEGFLESRTGLDHVSFQAGSRVDLESWMSWLDELGIAHTPIRDETEPFAYSAVVFRDPDNIRLEFLAVGQRLDGLRPSEARRSTRAGALPNRTPAAPAPVPLGGIGRQELSPRVRVGRGSICSGTPCEPGDMRTGGRAR